MLMSVLCAIVVPFAILIGSILLAFFFLCTLTNHPDDDDTNSMFGCIETPHELGIPRLSHRFHDICGCSYWISIPIAIIIGICLVLPLYLVLGTLMGVLGQLTVPVIWYMQFTFLIRIVWNNFL